MKKFSEQFNKKANEIKLKAFERDELKERLVSYMEYHPLVKGGKAEVRNLLTEKVTEVRIDLWLLSRVLGSAMVLVMVVVPLFAENTVPGDVLYPVKVRFNEEIRSTLTLSPYEKVRWETERLERRIAEAQLLAEEGRLTPEVEAEVVEAVKQHSENAKKEIASLSETDAGEATLAQVTLNSALEVQSEALGKKKVKNSSSSLAVAVLADVVADIADDDITFTLVMPSGEVLRARVEIETTRAYEYLDSIKSEATESEKDDIRRRLKDIEVKVKEATEADVINQSVLLEVVADVRKLMSFMTSIAVRQNVSVEDLVPVKLTLEERQANLENLNRQNQQLLSEVEHYLKTTPAELLEKYQIGLDRAKLLMVIKDGEETLSLEVKEANFSEASLILRDIEQGTKAFGTTLTDEEKELSGSGTEDESETSATNTAISTSTETIATTTPEEQI